MDSSLALYANFGIGLGLAGVLLYFSLFEGGDDDDDEMELEPDAEAPEEPPVPEENVVFIEDLIAAAPTLDEDASPDVTSSVATAETVEGGSSDDTLDGTDDLLSRTYEGGAGNDLILTAKLSDVVDGGEGDDTIRPAAGNDVSYGGAGNDVIVDGFGRDIHFGGEGADSLSGGANGDFLQGGAGADSLFGGGGSDSLAGGSDNDIVDGRSSQGDEPKDDGFDSLFGGTGDDQLFLDSGDQATGGEGADQFTIDEVAAGDGAVVITDFDAAEDEIAIDFTGSEDVPDPTVSVSTLDDGSGSQISLNDEVIATVAGAEGVDASEITLNDKTEENAEA